MKKLAVVCMVLLLSAAGGQAQLTPDVYFHFGSSSISVPEYLHNQVTGNYNLGAGFVYPMSADVSVSWNFFYNDFSLSRNESDAFDEELYGDCVTLYLLSFQFKFSKEIRALRFKPYFTWGAGFFRNSVRNKSVIVYSDKSRHDVYEKNNRTSAGVQLGAGFEILAHSNIRFFGEFGYISGGKGNTLQFWPLKGGIVIPLHFIERAR